MQLFHVYCQRLGREPVRLALPIGFPTVINGHQGIVINGTVRSRGTGGQFRGGNGRTEFACVRAGLLELHLHLIAAIGSECDGELVGFIA